MTLPRRKVLQLVTHLAAGAALAPVFPRRARAVDYPTRPVRLVDGFAAGGAVDIVARVLCQWLSLRLGQPFVVDNKPGAATNIATEEVVRAAPDGYTLLWTTTANTTNAAIYNNLSFNFIRDIAPVGSIDRFPLVMEVNPAVPAKTVPEFIAYAKQNPGKINYGTCRIAARLWCSTICWPGKCSSASARSPRRSAIFAPTGCGRLPSPARRARRRCRTCPR
jgi:tripartite-type tricarboxylate transporter receptor subunit TctC